MTKGINTMAPFSNILFGIAFLMSTNVAAIDLRIDNIRLYQPNTQTFSEGSRLYINSGKIIEVTTMKVIAKKTDEVVDANNQYAVSGLIDLHVHLGASGSNYSEFQYLPVKSHFNSNLYLGITNIVDLFSFEKTIEEAKNLKKTQAVPNFFYAGKLFTNPGGHGTQFGGSALEIAEDKDIEALWQEHIALKPHLTKAVIETFGGQGESLTDSQLAELGKRSKEANLPYFVHVSTLEDAKRAIKAGATALAHGINAEPIDDEFIVLMKDNNVDYIPTLAVYLNHSEESNSHALSQQSHLLATVPDKLQHCLFDNVPKPSKWRENAWKNRHHGFNNIKLLHQAGITIGTGSDAGNPYTLHGAALHNEIAFLNKAGLSAGEVINAATVNGAKIIGQENSIGQLSQGFEASFILLENNPLTDIKNLSHIQSVYKSGEIINRKALIKANQAIIPAGKECNKASVDTQAKNANSLIDDFNNETKWQAISDAMMGGKSNANLKQENGDLEITATLGKATAFGAWAGSHLLFPTPINAEEFQGVKIAYKSSQNSIGFSVYHSGVKDWDHFSTLIKPSESNEQWQTVNIPFSQLKQFGFGNQIKWSAKHLSGLSFVWRTMPGSESTNKDHMLKLGEISFY